MTKQKDCDACILEKRSIKTRQAVPHTCVKGDKGYKEPETKKTKEGLMYKIHINQEIYNTGKATKFSITARQYVNGYKVSAGSEVWFPNNMYYVGESWPNIKYIWVRETHYLTLAFV